MGISKLVPTVPSVFEQIEKTYQAFSPILGLRNIVANASNIAQATSNYAATPLIDNVVGLSSSSKSAYSLNLNKIGVNSLTTNMVASTNNLVNIADLGKVRYPFTDIISGLAKNQFEDNTIFINKPSVFENFYKTSDIITATTTGTNISNIVFDSLVKNDWIGKANPIGNNVLGCFDGSAALKIDPNGICIASSNNLFSQFAVSDKLTSLSAVMPGIGAANSCIAPKMNNVVSFNHLTGVNTTWNSAKNIVMPSVKNKFESFGGFVNDIVDSDKISSFMYGERASTSYSFGDTEVEMNKRYVGSECQVTINVYIRCVNYSGDIESNLAVLGNNNNVEYVVIKK